MDRFIRRDSWSQQASFVRASSAMKSWLTEQGSLSEKLLASCTEFFVQCLSQRKACVPIDITAALAFRSRPRVWQREVLLHCDGEPVVFGHTAVFSNAIASDWPFFKELGERPLGSMLFSDPKVSLGLLQFSRLKATHPLAKRVYAATGCLNTTDCLYARRRQFKRKNGLLLVSEVFLPKIITLSPLLVDAKTGAQSNIANTVGRERRRWM